MRASDSSAPRGLKGFDTREPHRRRLSARYRPISPPAPTAWPNCSTQATGGTAIPSQTAPIAAPASPSSPTYPTTGRTPPWRPFRCAALRRREYDDPLDRRFHAQPNACPVCGPKVWLTDAMGRKAPCDGDDAIREAARLLRGGAVVAIKGLGGFQLACDATDAAAVTALRTRKRRPDKPFAVMFRDVEEAHRHCAVTDAESRLLCAPEAPIVLLAWRPESNICAPIAPGNLYRARCCPARRSTTFWSATSAAPS